MCVLALVVAGTIIYSNMFSAPFVFDDINFITKNDPHVHMTTLSWDGIREAAFEGQPRKRFLPNISFALNYCAGGENTFGYHLVNLMIHLFSGVLLFYFVRTTLSLPYSHSDAYFHSASQKHNKDIGMAVAFFAALLWLVHPLQTNAVTYICQRMASMAALFFILSMLLYARGRILQRAKKPKMAIACFTGMLFSSACAFATKENTGMLPVFFLLYEWFFFQDLRNIFNKRILMFVGAALVIFLIVVIYYMGDNPFHRILASYGKRDFTLPQRVLTEFRVVAYYISLIVYPRPERLNLDYAYPLSYSMANPMTTFWAMGAIAGLLVLAFYSARRHRLAAFCILWFLGNLVIESSVIGIEIIFEHRNYLPMMLLCLLPARAAFKWMRPVNAAAVLAAVAVLAGTWTYQRNFVWETDVAFWSDIAQKSPRKARPYQNLAYSFQQKDRHAEAVRYYRKSLEFEPHPVAYFNLGLALAKIDHYAEAVDAMTAAVKMNYRTPGVYVNLAYALSNMGEFQAALEYFEQAQKLTPDDPNLGKNIRELKGFLNYCRTPLNCVIRRIDQQPQNAALYYKLGVMREQRKELALAGEAYETVLKKLPESDQKLYLLALNRLGVVCAAQGEIRRAADLFEQAVRLAPENPYFYYQAAVTYAGMQNEKEAVKWLDRAIEKGFSDFDAISGDKRWQFIRNTPYYQYLQDRL